MPRLSLWNPTKTKDFEFIDRIVGEHLHAGGTGVHVHKYLGIQDSPASGDPTRPGGSDKIQKFLYKIYYFQKIEIENTAKIFLN